MGNRFVASYDLLLAHSLLLNSLFGRLAFRAGSRAAAECPTGFIVAATKGRS
jgi:hypothetical protein